MTDNFNRDQQKHIVPDQNQQRTRETVTLLGSEGEQFAHKLAAYYAGKVSLEELGPGCDIAPNGTLRLHLDQASYEALELHKR